MNRRALVLALLCTVSCGPAAVPPPEHAPPLDPPDPPPATADASVEEPSALIEGVGVGATEAEAHAVALERLATELLGDAAWLELVAFQIHDPARDPGSADVAADGRSEVTLGLMSERAQEVLAAFADAEVQLEAPSPWAETLTAFVRVSVAAHACARQRALVDGQCEEVEVEAAQVALTSLAESVELASVYEGGVPIGADGSPLRAPSVLVTSGGGRVAGVPVRVLADEDAAPRAAPALSDAEGRATFALEDGADLGSGLRVVVDADALLGPLRAAWPAPEFVLAARATGLGRSGLGRYSVLVTEHARGHAARDGVLATALTRELGDRGVGAPLGLPRRVSRQLLRGDSDGRRRRLMELADEFLGRLDVVLVVEADSEFASRMGGSRVWYEARGTITVYDAWTGAPLRTLEATVTASGVGDERADRAARQKLAEALVRELFEASSPQAGAAVSSYAAPSPSG